jgi:predicted acylesterase/phospholipase RssA
LDAQGKTRKVAIACQGGGSHTAFTAGVLKRLLQAEELKQHEVVGLSGTSGGAVCALLAWHHLLRGDAAGAAEALDAFWRDNSATAPHEQIINSWVLWASSLQNFITMPVVSPYYDTYFSVSALEEFKRMLERQVDFAKVGLQPEDSYPALLVGAVDVLSGEFKTFNSRRDRITPETILASAAIPTLFRSVRAGDGGTYWDGLFSQNSPVRELTDMRPDEIWVIQINPKELETEPQTVIEIVDRRNELSGNLSLPGASFHRKDRLAARGGPSLAGRQVQADRSARNRAIPLALLAFVGHRFETEPRSAFHRGADVAWGSAGRRIPRSTSLRRCLEKQGSGGRGELLRRGRRASVVGAFPGKWPVQR